MRILIVDDEPLARERLKSLIAATGRDTVCGEADSGQAALNLIGECQPDVLLMDIRMPGMDGLEAAQQVAKLQPAPAVIFTTAFDQHALAAFETRAMDYLLKPVGRVRLEEALERVRERLDHGTSDKTQKAGAHICARGRNKIELIPLEEVIYLRADKKYITVRHLHGEALIEDSLKALEEKHPRQFIRIHRNALVNPAYLSGLERDRNGRLCTTFRNIDDCLEVSRRHSSEIRALVLGNR